MKQQTKLRIINNDTGICLAEAAILANTFGRRLQGLLGKRKLEKGREGLILSPCCAVHTFGMLFSLDLLFLSEKGEVLQALPSVRPWRFSPCVRGAHSVVELPAGTITATRTKKTHRLVFSELSA